MLRLQLVSRTSLEARDANDCAYNGQSKHSHDSCSNFDVFLPSRDVVVNVSVKELENKVIGLPVNLRIRGFVILVGST